MSDRTRDRILTVAFFALLFGVVIRLGVVVANSVFGG